MSDLPAGRALDVEIATKVFGLTLDWHHASIRARVAEHPKSNTGRGIYIGCDGCGRKGFGNEVDWAERCPTPECPPYSADIAAAWTVVEHLAAAGWHWVVSNSHDGELIAEFHSGWYDGCEDEWQFAHSALGATVPEAICLAALATLAQKE